MSKPSKPDHEFRPLPTPEQIRAHGEGGLREGDDEEKSHYKFWDRDRSTPWYDCSSPAGGGFCEDGNPWRSSAKRIPTPTLFRPLNPDGTPRDWAEIDAIVAGAKAPTTEPEFRRPIAEEIRAHKANGGVWERPPSSMTKFRWMGFVDNELKAWNSDEPMPNRNGGWLVSEVDPKAVLRPCDKQGKPIAWESLASPTQTAQDADTEWRPLPDTEMLKRHPYWIGTIPNDRRFLLQRIYTTDTGLYATSNNVKRESLLDGDRKHHIMVVGNPDRRWRPCDSAGTPIAWSAIAQPQAQPRIWSPQGDCKITKLEYSDGKGLSRSFSGIAFGVYSAGVSTFEGDLSQLPLVFDLIIEVPGANPPQIDILVGCRRNGNTITYIDFIIRNGKTLYPVPRIEIPTFQQVSGSVLDCFAAAWYNIIRTPKEGNKQCTAGITSPATP